MNLYSRDGDFWEQYMKGRTPVPDSYFDRIFAYHAAHGGHFTTAHDAGAGAGIHSTRLAKRFDKVIVTDVSEENIDVAKARLPHARYDFHVAKLEDTASFAAASVDLVFCGSMLHFTDVPLAIEAVAHQLRPKGTFVAACIALPRFIDPAIQEAWRNFFHAGSRQLWSMRALPTTIITNASAYDSIALPDRLFEPGAWRLKTNEPITDAPGGHMYLFLVPPEFRREFPAVSEIGSDAKMIWENDDRDWSFSKDMRGVKEFIATLPFNFETEEIKQCMSALNDAIGERVVDGYWIASTIIATRT